MKRVVVLTVGLWLVLSAVIVTAGPPEAQTIDSTGVTSIDSTGVTSVESKKKDTSDQIIVYYFHMNRRCMTCKKLEAYSKEAIEDGFVEPLQDSSIVLRIVNFEEEGNEHFAKDYQLYSQTLILSRQHEGEESEWKNLDKIWSLIGNRKEFTIYVQTEVNSFINPGEEE